MKRYLLVVLVVFIFGCNDNRYEENKIQPARVVIDTVFIHDTIIQSLAASLYWMKGYGAAQINYMNALSNKTPPTGKYLTDKFKLDLAKFEESLKK